MASLTTTNHNRELRARAANLALGVTVALTLFKVIVGILSHSVGVLSEGIHSCLDVVSAAVAFFTLREAAKEADLDHPFGHGKFEGLSSLFESMLLLLAAALIVFEAIEHVNHPQPLKFQRLAVITILISMGVSYLAYRQNMAVAIASESQAIRGNAIHFLADVVAGGGVLVGLLLIHFTGWLILDPLMAFSVAVYILAISAKQVKASLGELTDTTLPEKELAQIREIIGEAQADIIEAHDLRTRKSGGARHIDFHLVLCGEMSVNESHAVCDRLEHKIQSQLANSSVTIHVEPCEHENTVCKEDCVHRARKSSR